MKTSLLAPVACGAIAAAVSLAAFAQPDTAAKPTRTITRDELRVCLDNQDKLKARADDIKARIAKLNEEGDAIKAEDEQLQAEQKRVEESSVLGARDRFERKVKAHNARAKAATETGQKLKADGDQLTKELDAHNANCANVSVNKEDRDAVMKEREAAGKK